MLKIKSVKKVWIVLLYCDIAFICILIKQIRWISLLIYFNSTTELNLPLFQMIIDYLIFSLLQSAEMTMQMQLCDLSIGGERVSLHYSRCRAPSLQQILQLFAWSSMQYGSSQSLKKIRSPNLSLFRKVNDFT